MIVRNLRARDELLMHKVQQSGITGYFCCEDIASVSAATGTRHV